MFVCVLIILFSAILDLYFGLYILAVWKFNFLLLMATNRLIQKSAEFWRDISGEWKELAKDALEELKLCNQENKALTEENKDLRYQIKEYLDLRK